MLKVQILLTSSLPMLHHNFFDVLALLKVLSDTSDKINDIRDEVSIPSY